MPTRRVADIRFIEVIVALALLSIVTNMVYVTIDKMLKDESRVRGLILATLVIVFLLFAFFLIVGPAARDQIRGAEG